MVIIMESVARHSIIPCAAVFKQPHMRFASYCCTTSIEIKIIKGNYLQRIKKLNGFCQTLQII